MTQRKLAYKMYQRFLSRSRSKKKKKANEIITKKYNKRKREDERHVRSERILDIIDDFDLSERDATRIVDSLPEPLSQSLSIAQLVAMRPKYVIFLRDPYGIPTYQDIRVLQHRKQCNGIMTFPGSELNMTPSQRDAVERQWQQVRQREDYTDRFETIIEVCSKNPSKCEKMYLQHNDVDIDSISNHMFVREIRVPHVEWIELTIVAHGDKSLSTDEPRKILRPHTILVRNQNIGPCKITKIRDCESRSLDVGVVSEETPLFYILNK